MDRTKALVWLLTPLLLASCSQERALRVGSKNFTEQVILGEILAQHLERRLSHRIERRLNLGGTLLAHQALTSGEIDLYPEYSGTALISILKAQASTNDPADVRLLVRRKYRERFGLVWMEPLGFDNSFAMVVRDDAGVETLSQAARRPGGWRLGVGYEFETRPDGLPVLLEAYRLPLAAAPMNMDLGLLYRALDQNQVDMIAASATDGLLSVKPVRILADDLGAFPPYEASVVVSAGSLKRVPGLREALEELHGRFTSQTMRQLNYQVDGARRSVEEVARDFLDEWIR
ncbi:MAG: glycine betaine ABC transporter substrate-binding protein [Bryobacteraceae bacterium]